MLTAEGTVLELSFLSMTRDNLVFTTMTWDEARESQGSGYSFVRYHNKQEDRNEASSLLLF